MKKFVIILFSLVLILFTACTDSTPVDDYKLSVSAPSGAPGLALANMYNDNSDLYTFSMNKDAQALSSLFASKESDVIVAPINLGATMYNKNQNYQLCASVTFGNLYLISGRSDFDSISDLKGQKVTFFGSGTINQYIVERVLTENNITITTNENPSADEVSITYLGSTALTAQAYMASKEGIYLVAEPAVSNLKSKDTANVLKTISIQDEYKALTNQSYIQAACFIKKDTITNHKTVVDTFLGNLEASVNAASSNPTKTAEYAEALELGATKEVFELAIPKCGIGFVKGSSNKALVDELFSTAAALAFCGGVLPNEGFYYQA